MHLPLFQSKAVIKPLFELCGDGDDIKSQYYLFGKQFEYWFYTAWCANQVRFSRLVVLVLFKIVFTRVELWPPPPPRSPSTR